MKSILKKKKKRKENGAEIGPDMGKGRMNISKEVRNRYWKS